MVKLKFTGVKYAGDGVSCENGDVVEVSAEKAEQLLADFPDKFATHSEKAVDKGDYENKMVDAKTSTKKSKKKSAKK